jgi:hypothetical protein
MSLCPMFWKSKIPPIVHKYLNMAFYIWEFFCLKNIKISIFGGISKNLKLIVFVQILANFGSFRQVWADSIA